MDILKLKDLRVFHLSRNYIEFPRGRYKKRRIFTCELTYSSISWVGGGGGGRRISERRRKKDGRIAGGKQRFRSIFPATSTTLSRVIQFPSSNYLVSGREIINPISVVGDKGERGGNPVSKMCGINQEAERYIYIYNDFDLSRLDRPRILRKLKQIPRP